MRRDEQRLRDILEAITKIQRVATEGQEAFSEEEMHQVWVVHHVQVIGEAARALSEPFRKKHPEVPWSVIIGMRHILVHDYFGIDLDQVWTVVERDLPPLQRQVVAMLIEMQEEQR